MRRKTYFGNKSGLSKNYPCVSADYFGTSQRNQVSREGPSEVLICALPETGAPGCIAKPAVGGNSLCNKNMIICF